MASERKKAANRANAARSTGPRTKAGKAVAKMNAAAHGLRAAAPVVPGERAEDWEALRAGVVADLGPVGALEAELADRVALLTWRMRRVGRHEVAATVAAQDAAGAAAREAVAPDPNRRTPAQVRAELTSVRDSAASWAAESDRYRRLAAAADGAPYDGAEACRVLDEVVHLATFDPNEDDLEFDDLEFDDLEDLYPDDLDERLPHLVAAGVPDGFRGDPERWGGWTAGAVRAGVASVARQNELAPDALLRRAVREAEAAVADARDRIKRLEAELQKAEAEAARAAAEGDGAEAAARAQTVLPPGLVLDQVARYESHLSRQLAQALVLLKSLQKDRAAGPGDGPAALASAD